MVYKMIFYKLLTYPPPPPSSYDGAASAYAPLSTCQSIVQINLNHLILYGRHNVAYTIAV